MIQHNGLTYIFTTAALDEMSMPQQNKWVAVTDTNCPNCGAVITGPTCEYCGTRFRRSRAVEDIIQENQLLLAKIEARRQSDACKVLYETALNAMRMYSGGCITHNEARAMAGLKPI